MTLTADNIDGAVSLDQAEKEYKEAIDIFPALHKYQAEHSAVNLQKLCVEIAEFCRAVYASTQSDEERKIYYSVLEKIIRQP